MKTTSKEQLQEILVGLANGKSKLGLSKETGVSRQLIQWYAKRNKDVIEFIEKDIAFGCIEKAREVLNNINDEKILKSTAAQLAIVMGTLIDKSQLLQGKPTVIATIPHNDDELRKFVLEGEGTTPETEEKKQLSNGSNTADNGIPTAEKV